MVLQVHSSLIGVVVQDALDSAGEKKKIVSATVYTRQRAARVEFDDDNGDGRPVYVCRVATLARPGGTGPSVTSVSQDAFPGSVASLIKGARVATLKIWSTENSAATAAAAANAVPGLALALARIVYYDDHDSAPFVVYNKTKFLEARRAISCRPSYFQDYYYTAKQ